MVCKKAQKTFNPIRGSLFNKGKSSSLSSLINLQGPLLTMVAERGLLSKKDEKKKKKNKKKKEKRQKK